MSYLTGFETGAQTFNVNGLILYVESSRELAELRDKIWQQSGGDKSPLIEFCKKCVSAYNRQNVSDEPIQLSVGEISDFVRLYAEDYYEAWKYENVNDVAQSSESVLQVLSECITDGNIVRLPPRQLERSLYNEVKTKLERIGGKWKGGKIGGFVFAHNPAELLQQVAGGADRNLKKEFQFFETPDNVADQVIELAEIEPHMTVCEPEAGRAALIKAMWRAGHKNLIWAWELNDENRAFLENLSDDINVIGKDFLKDDESFHGYFDRIIANPPFSNNQDIDHLNQMFKYLKPRGMIVSVMSVGWTFNSKKKPTEFREWIDKIGAEVIKIDNGAFKESGTNVATCIVVIRKPA
jgi:hypothetical protein